MRKLFQAMALMATLCAATTSHAVQPDEILPNPAEETRARNLSRELRCMVCQNQSIDDSDAPLARDLRLLVRERITAGDSDRQVIDFLVGRYGEFVLLKPRLEGHTLILWAAAPAVFLLGALALWMNARRRRAAPAGTAALNVEEQAALRRLMEKGNSDGAASEPRA